MTLEETNKGFYSSNIHIEKLQIRDSNCRSDSLYT